MKCPRCEHQNPQGARFCEERATPLPQMCSKCGTPLSATAKFCHACARQTGRNARARSSYRQAASFLEQALEILKRLPETAENAARRVDLLCRDLWDPLMILPQYQRLLEHQQRAAVLAEKVGDRARSAEVLARTVSPRRNNHRDDDVPRDGHDVLAGEGGGGTALMHGDD